MNNSSTTYLDDLFLDQQGLVTREVMDSIKEYCGLFSFVHGVCRDDLITEANKVKLINSVIDAALTIQYKKHKANVELYKQQVSENIKTGKLFQSLAVLPAKMTEDFEIGLDNAKEYLYEEIRDILKILNIQLDL